MLGLCELLERLPAWIAEHGVDDDAVSASQRVTRYFTTAARLHHQDEEQDLFPLLRQETTMTTLITELQQDHQRLEDLWQSLADQLEPTVRQYSAASGLADAIATFCQAYRRHIEREDTELLPRARELLDAQQCAALGTRMAARRGHDAD